MGGHGSGRRYRWGTKELTTDRRRLDVRSLARAGMLEPGSERTWCWTTSSGTNWITIRAAADRLTLTFRYRLNGGEWQPAEQVVPLDWTRPNYGGRRPWLRCPLSRCGRRVAILYGAELFVCRKCAGMAYPSQNENAQDRALRRGDKIRARVGGRAGLLNPFPDKPKGMHERTYQRLRWEAREAEQDALLHLAGWLGRADARIARLGLWMPENATPEAG